MEDDLRLAKLALSDPGVRILATLARGPLGASAISARTGIPIASTYRAIRVLKDAGLLGVDGPPPGVRGPFGATHASMYRSHVKAASLVVHAAEMHGHVLEDPKAMAHRLLHCNLCDRIVPVESVR